MFEICNRSTRCCSGVFIVNFEYIWHIALLFFCFVLFFVDFKHVNSKWNTLLPLIFKLSKHFKVGFKMKLFVTTVNNSYQLFPIFYHKELHLRCCIGLELNIVTSAKILKRYQAAPHPSPPTPPPPTPLLTPHDWMQLIRPLDALKIHLQRFFTLN